MTTQFSQLNKDIREALTGLPFFILGPPRANSMRAKFLCAGTVRESNTFYGNLCPRVLFIVKKLYFSLFYLVVINPDNSG